MKGISYKYFEEKYLIGVYGDNYMKIKYYNNLYEEIFINNGITKNDIKKLILSFIFMSIHRLPLLKNYWKKKI